MFIDSVGPHQVDSYIALGKMVSDCLSSLVERVEAVFSYVRDSLEKKLMSLSLSNQGAYFKAHPEIAQKTAKVLRENGIHSIDKKLGKGGFGAVFMISSDFEKPRALKLLEEPEQYLNTEGQFQEPISLGIY